MQQGSPGREEVEEEVILVMMTLAGGVPVEDNRVQSICFWD